MVLQTLVALSSLSLFPVGPATIHETITIAGAGHSFTAEVFTPRNAKMDSRYPGAVIIGTEETKERALVVASRLSEIGVTVMMFTRDEYATQNVHIYEAKMALDSLRRRTDVRPEEVGIVAFEEATSVVPDLVRDTGLSFAIAAATGALKDVTSRYSEARTATLVVQGVNKAASAAPLAMTNITQADANARTEAPPPVTTPIEAQKMGPNVTLWPVPREQLETIGEARSPLGARVVGWVKEQVHVAPGAQQLPTMNIK